MHARLDSLTGLRFFAAYFVLLHHVTNFARLPVLVHFEGFGATGVTFFFVLSGFVLTWSFRPSDAPRPFYWRRFARIVPLHVLTTLIALPVFYAMQGEPVAWGPVLLSLGLLQAWTFVPGIYFAGNPAAWSLSCELFFYALHPLAIRRVLAARSMALAIGGGAFLAAMAAVAQIALGWPGEFTGWLLYIAPPFRLGEFALGVVLAVLTARGYRAPLGLLPATALLAGWFVFTYVVGPRTLDAAMLARTGSAGYAILPLLYGLVIVAAARLDLEARPSVLRWKPMVRLGEWSYALYLVHATIIYALMEVFGTHYRAMWTNLGWLALASVIAIAASALLYHLVEQPLERWLRAHEPGKASPAPAIPASVEAA